MTILQKQTLSVLGSLLFSVTACGMPLQVLYSDGNGSARLVRENVMPGAIPDGAVSVAIRSSDDGQRWQGAGAALTDSSVSVLSKMNADDRSWLLRKLFSPDQGNLNVLRLSIGANDFTAHGNYDFSAREGSTDYAFEERTIVPWVKQIAALQPHLALYAAPWSPPGWMKDSGSMNGGSLRPAYYQAYAHYLAGWVRLYARNSLPVAGLSVQNEPLHDTRDYPSAALPAAAEARFVHDYLKPALLADGLGNTPIFGLDHNWNDWQYAQELTQSPAAGDFAGYAFHCYGGKPGDAENLIPALRSDQTLLMTECSPLQNSPFSAGFQYDMTNLVFGTLQHHGSAIIMWNLILDEKGGPTNGGCITCEGMATVDRSKGATSHHVSLGSSYFALAQVTAAAQTGDRILPAESSSPGILGIAFEHVNGTRSLLVYNSSSHAVTIHSRLNNQTFSYTLPSKRAATFAPLSQIK